MAKHFHQRAQAIPSYNQARNLKRARDRAERALIYSFHPCLNKAVCPQNTPLPQDIKEPLLYPEDRLSALHWLLQGQRVSIPTGKSLREQMDAEVNKFGLLSRALFSLENTMRFSSLCLGYNTAERMTFLDRSENVNE